MKLCILTSLLFGCLVFLLCLNTTLGFDHVGKGETPISGTISEHPKPSTVSNFTHQLPWTPINKLGTQTNNFIRGTKCDIFDGRWVYRPEEKRSYDTNSCPFMEDKFNCHNNGRPDWKYEKWRWQPKKCNIPLFNGKYMLERLRNKRVIIVGDSLNRNMFGSLACLLYSSVPSSTVQVSVLDTHYMWLKAKDYNCTVEFHWSPFLVELDTSHKSGKTVIVLDKLSLNSDLWRGADVMVFNSAHWWTHTGKLKHWDLLEYKGKLYETMPTRLAYKRGMLTWKKWISKNVDPRKTSVFFKSVAPDHNGGNGCFNVTQPLMDESYKNKFPRGLTKAIEDLIAEMRESRVKYLNITKLSEYRIDGHPSVYRDHWRWKIYTTKYKRLIRTYADCSHWCLPGLPDTWNRLLYASLFFDY